MKYNLEIPGNSEYSTAKWRAQLKKEKRIKYKKNDNSKTKVNVTKRIQA